MVQSFVRIIEWSKAPVCGGKIAGSGPAGSTNFHFEMAGLSVHRSSAILVQVKLSPIFIRSNKDIDILNKKWRRFIYQYKCVLASM